jgi:hypothetical protein
MAALAVQYCDLYSSLNNLTCAAYISWASPLFVVHISFSRNEAAFGVMLCALNLLPVVIQFPETQASTSKSCLLRISSIRPVQTALFGFDI